MINQVAVLGVDVETAKAKAALQQFDLMTASSKRLETAFRAFGVEADRIERKFGTLNKRIVDVRGQMKTLTDNTKSSTGAMATVGKTATDTGARLIGMGKKATAASGRLQTVGRRSRAAETRLRALGTQATKTGDKLQKAGIAVQDVGKSSTTAARSISAVGHSSRKAQREFANFARSSSSHAEGFMGVVLRLAAVFGGIRLAMSGIRTIATFEDIKDSFTSLNDGNLFAGEKQFEFVRQYARTSPQTLEEVASAVVGLQNNQIKPTEELLRLFSDVASVTSDQRGAFAQAVKLWQRGKQGGLGVEELDILSNRGVDVYGAINRRLGLTRRQVGNMGQDAAGAMRIVKALETEWQDLYGGASIRRLDNLSVKWNAFLDTTKEVAEQVGKGMGRSLHDKLDKTSGFIDKNIKSFQALGYGIGAVVNRLTDFLKLTVAINQVMGNIPFIALGGIMSLFVGSGIIKVLRLISPIGFIGRSIGAITAGAKDFKSGISTMRETAKSYRTIFGVGAAGGAATLDAFGGVDSRDFDAGRFDENRMVNQHLAGVRRLGDEMSLQEAKRLSFTHKMGFAIGALAAYMSPLSRAFGTVGLSFTRLATPLGVLGSLPTLLNLTTVAGESENINAALKDMGQESATFGEIWKANRRIIGEDIVEAVGKAGRAIDDAFGNAPSRFAQWIESFSKKGAGTLEEIGAGYSAAMGDGVEVTGTGEIRTVTETERKAAEARARRRAIEIATDRFLADNEDPNNPGFLRYGPGSRTGVGRERRGIQYRLQQGITFYERKQQTEIDRMVAFAAERRAQTAAANQERARMFGASAGRMADLRDDLGPNADAWRTLGIETGSAEHRYLRGQRMDLMRRGISESIQGREDYYFGAADNEKAIEEVGRFEQLIGNQVGTAFRTIGGKGEEAIHDMVDNLGRELNAQVFDHAVGTPFRKLLTNLMNNIYEALTDSKWWRKGPVGDLTSAIGSFWSKGTVDGIPSASEGGYTGRMSGPGIDGRGGRPWILHDDEFIVPGQKMRSGSRGGPSKVTVNVYGADDPDRVAVTQSVGPEGETVNVFLDAIIDDLHNGGKVSRTLQNVLGLERVAH